MKHERGTKRENFEEEKKWTQSSRKANVAQINYENSCQEWNLLKVF